MAVVALVMAGGRATRLGGSVEKPLLKVSGKTLISRVIDALRQSKMVGEIIVAVSDSTPKTARVMRCLGIEVVSTPGGGFCSDMNFAIRERGISSPVLVISSDLPLVTGELIDEILAFYRKCGKPALTVAAPVEDYGRLGMKAEHLFQAEGRRLVPAGINVVDGSRINSPYLEEAVMTLKRVDPIVNVNTPDDIRTAERLLREQRQSRG